MTRLNPKLRPNRFYSASDPSDVARVEGRTFICSEPRRDAGPTNNWLAPAEMRETLAGKFSTAACAAGPCTSCPSAWARWASISALGVEITDSAYVVVSMRIMTRMGQAALASSARTAFSCPPSIRSARRWARPGRRAVALQQHQIHRPLSGEPGDLVLRLRLWRQRAARQEVLRAAHRLGDGPRRGLAGRAHADPEADLAGRRGQVLAAAFPSACGKTNLAMLQPTLPGWKAETIGDDIAWMRFGDDGRLYAINPEFGFFGVAPGTGMDTNPNAIDACPRTPSSPTSP